MRPRYNDNLKPFARQLRSNLTNAESLLWHHIRRKQILDVQFYRQRIIGDYIVDFFAPSVRLVIEIDGSQHFETEHIEKDKRRDEYLNKLGIEVLRFDNLQVLRTHNSVLEEIYNVITNLRNPPTPFEKGEQAIAINLSRSDFK